MGRRGAVVLVLSGVWACTQDYDQFELVDTAAGSGAATSVTSNGSTGSATSTTGSATGGGGGSGGAVDCGPCRIPNGKPGCVDGVCAVGSCDPGHGDCNDVVADGCETPTDADLANCGECDRACDQASVSTAICTAGLCASTCNLGRANCNQPATGADDGCELDVTADSANCGGCANKCSSQGFGTGFVCQNLACRCTTSAECKGGGNGSAICDAVSGKCTCDGTPCQQGEACVKQGPNQICKCNGGNGCAAPQVCCQSPGGCKDLMTDAADCGACGRACAPGLGCSAGACG